MTSQTLAPADPRDRAIAPRGIVLALAAATLLLLVVIAGAALSGDWAMDPRAPTMPVAPAPATEAPAPQERPENIDSGPGKFSWIASSGAAVAGAVAVAVLVFYLVRWIRRTLIPWLANHIGQEPPPAVQPMLQVPLARLAEATVHAETLLADTTPPTDAIIAAWLALEDAAVRSGAARAPAQTPTEFTLAVLSTTPASPQAVAELLALYHRARFAHTDMTADQVSAARAALRRLTDDFRRRSLRAQDAEAVTVADAEAGPR